MKSETDKSRRNALKIGLGFTGALIGLGSGTKVLAQVCGLTPKQPKGPFYPIDEQLDTGTDLTRIGEATEEAIGQKIYISGTVRDQDCNPVSDALVEIWQANASGRYNHPADESNPAPIDPHFQYWGRVETDSEGKYLFKTILPGSYPAAPGWIRPAHIHYRVSKLGYFELITQLYFKGDKYLETDEIYKSLPPSERSRVVTELLPATEGFDLEAKIGQFDITLRRVVP